MACDISSLQAAACANGYAGASERKLLESLLVALCNAGSLVGDGSPEGVVTASPGSLYVQTDAGGALWAKITGAGDTGWILIGPASASGGPQLYTGSGSPEGIVTAAVGSQYTDITAGVYVATYYKQTGVGNTGWA